jgi:hypothetical protein
LYRLGGEHSQAVSVEVLLYAVNQIVRLLRGEQPWHELHNPRIGVDSLKGDPVRVAPTAESESIGG